MQKLNEDPLKNSGADSIKINFLSKTKNIKIMETPCKHFYHVFYLI
jgi:hypothetical protein